VEQELDLRIMDIISEKVNPKIVKKRIKRMKKSNLQHQEELEGDLVPESKLMGFKKYLNGVEIDEGKKSLPKTDLRKAFDDAYDKAYAATEGDHGKKSDAGHAAGNKAHQGVLNNMKPLRYKGMKEANSPTYYLTQVGLEFFHESSEDEANKQKLALQHLDMIARGQKHSLPAKKLRDQYRELEGKTSPRASSSPLRPKNR